MRKIILLFLISISASAQYTISPWNGSNSQTSCPTSNDYCVSTTLGNTVKLAGVFYSGSTTSFRFVLVKCDGTSFSTGGTFYLKTGGVCGNIINQTTVSTGTTNSVTDQLEQLEINSLIKGRYIIRLESEKKWRLTS